jgi:predicted O-linked N-acetylglucosamine transferase (SPINDLY family)
MASDVLTTALIQSMARNFSVHDLIATTESLKQGGQPQAVETLYATWVQHNADNPLIYAVLFNYSVVLTDIGKLEVARQCLERAIELNPDFIPAYINLGRVYERMGSTGLAVLKWSAALARMAGCDGQTAAYKVTTLNQSARTLETANQDVEAEALLRQSLELDGHQSEVIQHIIALRQRQCEWPILAPSERVDRAQLMRRISPLSIAALTDDPLLHLALAAHYNERDVGTPAEVRLDFPAVTASPARLRIGYLSSDLREHAVGFLMTEVLGLHDRNQVEVFAYYCGPPSKDALHEHFKSTVDHFVLISDLDDAAAARRIEADGIHILVDLNGYTREARLKLVAMRPAPIIVNWLGFPGTMGSPYHHYIIADDWIVPESHEPYYSEKVLRLPCYQPSARERVVADLTTSRADAGLPEHGVVYCCFNGVHKINRFTFDRWLMILAQVEGSVLWLLSSGDATNERLRSYAAARGIKKERLVFAEKLANAHHLARYTLADLFLDTTPYGAHTTASDALWRGVPVLTLSGRSFASRVCGSLVRAAGTPEMVCESAGEFVERAVALGKDPAALAALRAKLSEARATAVLFDMPQLVRRLESLYREIWTEYEQGRRPEPDLMGLDACLDIGCQVDHEAIEVQTLPDYAGWWRQALSRRMRLRPFARAARFAALDLLE